MTGKSISAQVLEQLEKDFICPIGLEMMEKPYKTKCGHTFEESTIKQWINRWTTEHAGSSPFFAVNSYFPNPMFS